MRALIRARLLRRAALGLAAVLGVLCVLGFLSAASEVNHIRNDFCDWTTQHYRTDLTEAQTGPRRADERSDAQLKQKLGC